MAFREPWQEEDGAEPSPSIFPWMAVVAGGLILGLLIFTALIPGGPLHPLVEQAAKPQPTSQDSMQTDLAIATATTCPSPLADPPLAVQSFIESLNDGNYTGAWADLGPTLKDSSYQDDIDAFTQEWRTRGRLVLRQTTSMLPSNSQVTILASLSIGENNPTSVLLRFQLVGSPDNCEWLISGIAFPSEYATETPPSEPTP